LPLCYFSTAAFETPHSGRLHYVIWWQHWAGAPDKAAAIAARLAGVALPHLDSEARATKAPPIFWPSRGVPIAPGDGLNLVFQRRAATPW